MDDGLQDLSVRDFDVNMSHSHGMDAAGYASKGLLRQTRSSLGEFSLSTDESWDADALSALAEGVR